jgi:hypothetical protein
MSFKVKWKQGKHTEAYVTVKDFAISHTYLAPSRGGSSAPPAGPSMRVRYDVSADAFDTDKITHGEIVLSIDTVDIEKIIGAFEPILGTKKDALGFDEDKHKNDKEPK